ncbi:MAG TPA: glycerol kinase GlpK [Candidatus Binataceae bacterium]|nr:glycerol kinase GlpK [Candidatus Binataceae bacterium]
MAQNILAIDQGTTGTTTMVIGAGGRVLGRAYREIGQRYPQPGWVEQNPEEIYQSVIEAGRAAIRRARIGSRAVTAIGIANQRETFVLWERTSGRPVHPAIVWQCRRSADICRRLASREAEIIARTGLLVDPYFSATKLKWLLDNHPDLRRRARRGELCFGTIDSWLVFRLTRGAVFVTDFTNASRTMLFNLERMDWDPAMLRLMRVPEELLPRVIASRGPLAEAAAGTLAAHPIPIAALIGDQQAAMYGQGAVRAGQAKATYGTGAFLLIHTGHRRVRSHERLISTTALTADGRPAFALEGSVFIAGAAIQWLRDKLGLIRKASDSLSFAHQSPSQSHPYLVPAFVGLGAPYWDSEARGAIVGITRGTTRADIVRAALDSIAYQVADVASAMERDVGVPVRELRVDGGASANDYLMQFQADLLGRRIRRPVLTEATALGAAMLAGLAVGTWKSPAALEALRRTERVFTPSMNPGTRAALLDGWHRAVARVLTGERGPRALVRKRRSRLRNRRV